MASSRSRPAPTNPFRYSTPVGIDDLIDRDDETELLLTTAAEGNNSRLVAPRRFGKTSLLRRVVGEAEADGWTGVYVDFFGVLTLAEMADRVERAYASSLTGPLARWFDGLRRTLRPTLTAGAGPVSATARLDPVGASLAERLDLPLRVHEKTGRRVLVVFDEFQEIVAAEGNADSVLRAAIQHHGDAASYIFAGSHVGMMTSLFTDRKRAFYAQAKPIQLPPLDATDCAEFIAGRFAATGKDVGDALGPLLDATQGHPQRTVLLAHAVWDLVDDGGRADGATLTTAHAQLLAELADEYRVLWTDLPSTHRRALAAISRRVRPYGRAAAGSRGGAVSAALARLIERGDLVKDATQASGYRVVDPLLAAWVRELRDGT
jgi:AAA+ ATPase superfamily predicted ATPase